jgi:Leucine-rich repeat (LRR) protein
MQISDLSPLATLESLKSLNLDNTLVSDLSPLAELNNLRTLYLVGQRQIRC